MARNHRNRNTCRNGGRAGGGAAAPERSEAMKAVMEEARRLREQPDRRDGDMCRRMKPKAVRRFERYAGTD